MPDVGERATTGIFQTLGVDSEWSNPIRRGFEWWGHRLRQRVWSTPGYDDDGITIHRVFAVTDVLRNIDAPTTKVDSGLGTLGAWATGSALVFLPTERNIQLWCAGTVHEDVVDWMTQLLSSYAILQVIEGERHAVLLPKSVSGIADYSAHPKSGERPYPDDMLTIVDQLFRPKGGGPSPWRGSAEFTEIRDMLNHANCFSMGDENGLTAEFPFGGTTSMLRIVTDEHHSDLGSGVGLFLHVPMWGTYEEATGIAGALNRAEASRGAIGHLLGSWCCKTIGDRSLPAFAFFLPAVLYRPNLLTNLTFSIVRRAQWVNALLNPDIPPGDVADIVSRRFSELIKP